MKNMKTNLKGFSANSDKISFGAGGVIGNEKVYFDAEKIKIYNDAQTDSKSKIKEIEFGNSNSVDSLILRKEKRKWKNNLPGTRKK